MFFRNFSAYLALFVALILRSFMPAMIIYGFCGYFESFLMFLRFYSNTFCDFVELEPDANEGRRKIGSKTNGDGEDVVGGGGTGARCRRAGFRRDSENLHVEQRHWRLHHVVAAARRQ
jgi:hypothetical protein